jgi:hypothetical protein
MPQPAWRVRPRRKFFFSRRHLRQNNNVERGCARSPMNVKLMWLCVRTAAKVRCQRSRLCLDIGMALGSPVSLDYREKAPFKFNGTINKVNVKYIPQPTK